MGSRPGLIHHAECLYMKVYPCSIDSIHQFDTSSCGVSNGTYLMYPRDLLGLHVSKHIV